MRVWDTVQPFRCAQRLLRSIRDSPKKPSHARWKFLVYGLAKLKIAAGRGWRQQGRGGTWAKPGFAHGGCTAERDRQISGSTKTKQEIQHASTDRLQVERIDLRWLPERRDTEGWRARRRRTGALALGHDGPLLVREGLLRDRLDLVRGLQGDRIVGHGPEGGK